MKPENKAYHLLSDYKPSPYQIQHADLIIKIKEDWTEVCSSLKIQRRSDTPEGPLILDGVDLELLEIKINGTDPAPSAYEKTERYLRIVTSEESFTLSTVCKIVPRKNLSLEGIYQSKNTICSQCEAEGFRKITWFLDRPDNMSTFMVRLEASKRQYPVLLSNGHCIEKGDVDSEIHFATWNDPFPKPSYLFAVVAGQLDALEDTFKTKSGRSIRLSIYAQKQDISKCSHAMDSLKKSMKWDEEVFGLECDLDHYQIVAISDFNMGAMENKGLNIFNSSLVLANPDIAQDATYQDILAVIGHEYFHNWTGNRVTCRDWFQLCLKEGLTVFRDQEFSAEMYSRPVKRIEEIKLLRQHQWPEDDGPMSHPPRPDRYQEINNFYTSTVYNKGAEVVRLLKTLIGDEAFFKGMKIYFEKHDGQAVCQEDFVNAMAEASGQDLTQFMKWYTEAGTPVVTVSESWNEHQKLYQLTFTQETCSGAEPKKKKDPRVIPVTIGLLSQSGNPVNFRAQKSENPSGPEATIILSEEKETISFFGLSEKPVPSLFRNFSAPVRQKTFLSADNLAFLMAHDTDPVNVWDSGQNLYHQNLAEMTGSIRDGLSPQCSEQISMAFGSVLSNLEFDPAFKALALTLPSEGMLSIYEDVIDPVAIHQARESLCQFLAERHKKQLTDMYLELNQDKFSLDGNSMGRRSLKNTCLAYLARIPGESESLLSEQYDRSDNMTDRISALSLIHRFLSPEIAEASLEDFYQRWKHEEQAIDQWFSIRAGAPMKDPKASIDKITKHEAFNLDNPNRMRSVYSVFCYRNMSGFHQTDGSGYQLTADVILQLDKTNRQMSSHLCKAFNIWKKLKEPYRGQMENSLKYILNSGKLSPDLNEVVTKFLAP